MKNLQIYNLTPRRYLFLITLFLTVFIGCRKDPEVVVVEDKLPTTYPADVAVKWAEMANYVAIRTVSNTPTYASRSLGYLGLTMYETVQAGSGRNRSLAGQVNDLKVLPTPEEGKRYNWEICLNAGQSVMMKKMYGHASDFVKGKIDSLTQTILTESSKIEKPDVIERSINFGESIANNIYTWSLSDGGHQGYSRNFPVVLIPTGDGKWGPPVNGQVNSKLPLHPFWGENRTFIKANSELNIPPILEYSTDPRSAYYSDFLEVYEKNKVLTQEEKEIAIWWSDDPSETFAPPGHSYHIATIAVKKVKPDIFKAAETYARVGMAVADAFINCWKCKYHYYSERPASYVNKHIDARWVQFWPEPPFPAFTSGHATQGMAGAVVLTDLYGDNFEFVDNAHEGRPMNTLRNVEYKVRSFKSFKEAAVECGYSRLLGGIHTRQDNEVGAAEGTKIANNVNALMWKR